MYKYSVLKTLGYFLSETSGSFFKLRSVILSGEKMAAREMIGCQHVVYIYFSALSPQRRHVQQRGEVTARDKEGLFFQRHAAKINGGHRAGRRPVMSC